MKTTEYRLASFNVFNREHNTLGVLGVSLLIVLLMLFQLAGLSVARGQLAPELMFKDTFTVAAETMDISADLSGRQSGKWAPLIYIENAPGDEQSILTAAGKLQLLALNNVVYLSPDHNFIEGGQFAIEFDVNAGLDDADNASGDWCAIVFGATRQNVFVNDAGAAGFGILFRNNGDLEVWDGGTRVTGGSLGYTGGIPKNELKVRIEAEAPDFNGSPARISLFINGTQVALGAGGDLAYTKAGGFRANYVTLEGAAFGGNNWTHTFDNFSMAAVPCIDLSPKTVDIVRGKRSGAISVTAPTQLATSGGQVTVTSRNPAVAAIEGADASGKLTLEFPGGGVQTKVFYVTGVGAGSALLQFESAQGACINGTVQVNVAAGEGLDELVFQDTFNAGATFDLNAELGGRQSGTAGLLKYVEIPEHMAGGAADDFTSIADGKLTLLVTDRTWVSPDYNFVEGGSFTIEADVNPSVGDPGRTTDDWAAIVFGATTSGPWVNGSDGLGILFRSNGGYQLFDGGGLVYSSAAEDALPAGELKVKIQSQTLGFSGTSPAVVTFTVNGNPLKVASDGGNTYTRGAGFRANRITLQGYAAAGNTWTYAFDNFKVTAAACVHFQQGPIVLGPGDTPPTVTVKVPEQFVPGQGAETVTVVSLNPAVAEPVGATEGKLVLTFTAPGPLKPELTKTFDVKINGKGRARFELQTVRPVCLGEPLIVDVLSALVKNPSFENNPPSPAWPHYGPIEVWAEGSAGHGVNDTTGPFHDNGAIPDQGRIGFAQGNHTIGQMITGLTPNKRYWVQLRYNARGCCGGAVPDMTVRFEGVDLGTVTGIQPVGGANPYYSRTFGFVPQSSSGRLEIVSAVQGDATLLVDAVTIVQRDEGQFVVDNPSFEASGDPPAPGYITTRLSGWVGTGQYGVNRSGAGPFADNGTNPDQDNVAFIQGKGSLSQTLSGLVTGDNYTVSYAYNARLGNTAHLLVKAGGKVLQDEDVAAVGGSAAYRVKTATFAAEGDTVVLSFEQTVDGDQTVLIDDVEVAGKAPEKCLETASPRDLEIGIGQANTLVSLKANATAVEQGAFTVSVTSENPAIATPAGAVNGVLNVEFAPGGELVKTFDVIGVGRGATRFVIGKGQGSCVASVPPINVTVVAALVRNPSFEANSNPQYPGYGPINAWVGEGPGNTGLNNSSGPFHDNGLIPDRGQIALLQVDKVMRQTIIGLTPGKSYWLQFYYNTRNCCGGSIDLSARFAGTELVAIPGLAPVGQNNPYNFQHLVFTPSAVSGDLEFATTTQGDATALLDAVTIVQRDAGNVVLVNPSFEASGIVGFPGYIQPARIAGWAGTGNYGVNRGGFGPFADNGLNPDQDSAAFLQGEGASLTQTASGFQVGTRYTLSYAYNARGGNAPRLKVTIGANTAQDESVAPVGGANPYPVRRYSFTADAETMDLVFTQTAAGDNTIVLDNVAIAPGEAPPDVKLSIQRSAGGTVRVAWPSAVTGYDLESATQITGPWGLVTAPVVIEGGSQIVTEPIGAGNRYYRLKKR